MAVKVEVWGDYACFSRPELKVERVSYDVMTPSAARGLLEAIYWHPGLKWVIDTIYVLAPISVTSIRRNEVKDKLPAGAAKGAYMGNGKPLALYTGESIQQRATLALQNVHYVIEAHFEMTDKAETGDNPGKFQDIMRRRLEKGQCYHQPCFGTREFPAHFRAWPSPTVPTIPDTCDLGYMLYDMDYSNPEDIRPMFFRGKLEHGVLHVPSVYSQEVVR
ncbi:type I-C CRISPR-associated protein Cas5c [Bengtsoniella intestinalis]|uniref:type I-C CRISPR-associated protein Cas5c n=1 Tax=Bengtsoniella intestinalis TaxID=3073143 RepID=UPI00391F1785